MREDKNKGIEEITKQLEDGVKAVFDSGKFEQYLDCMSKFWNYSVNNSILIFMQKPEATLVAGYQSWQKNFKRQVKKGEKAIKIMAPIPHKILKEVEDEEGNKSEQEIKWTSFRAVPVFDVSQTEGEELPSLCNDLSGEVEGYEDLIQRLIDFSPVPVAFDDIQGTAKGFYSLTDKKIVIRAEMSQIQTVKTLVHEISHSILHNLEDGAQKEVGKGTKEVQAEGTAYTVCKSLGIDTSDYSFGYVAGWSEGKDLKELQASLEIIRTTAKDMLEAIRG